MVNHMEYVLFKVAALLFGGARCASHAYALLCHITLLAGLSLRSHNTHNAVAIAVRGLMDISCLYMAL